MDADEVRRLLKAKIREEGVAKSRFAMNHGVSIVYLDDVLAGRRKPGPGVLNIVGLKKAVSYEPK